MPSLWNERAMLIDAEKVALLAPAAPLAHGRSRPHGGDPAGAAAELLADSRRRRGAWRNRLRVWIGYPWAHAQVLPWQVTLGGGDHQWEAYARALMRERGVAGPLRLRLEAGRHGRARLAFGIDAGLLDALERMASAGGWRLWSCHDLLSSCLARHRAALRDSGGLVLAETGALSCLWRSAQGWEDLITLRRDPGQSLETLLSAPNCCAYARAGTAIAGRPCARRMRCPCRTPRAGWARRIPCWRWRHEGPDKRDGGLRAARRAQWRLPGRRRAAAGRGWPDGLARMERPGPAPRGRVHGGQPGAAPPPAGTRAAPQAGAIARGARDRGPAVAPAGRGPAAPAILRAVEKAWSPRVAMLGLKLEAGGKSARVEMLVASLKEAFAFVQRLNAAQPGFTPWSSAMAWTGDPNRAIVVSIFVEVR
ncbi:hypothetical protein WJ970_34615 [Achromobacter xylosoxidans]